MTQDTFIPTRPTSVQWPKWVHEANYRWVDKSNIAEALREVVSADVVAWDTEFNDTQTGQDVSAISFSTKPASGWVIPLEMSHHPNLHLKFAERFLKAFAAKRNVAQYCRAEMRSVRDTYHDWEERGLLNITDDIQVIYYLLDPNEAKDFRESRPRGGSQPIGFSLASMARKYMKLEVPDLGPYYKDGNKFSDLDPDLARVYAASDADVTLRLFRHGMDPALRDSFIYKLEMSLLRVLLEMELLGFRFETSALSKIEQEARKAVSETRIKAYELLKMDPAINIDSVAKLADHLYLTLGLHARRNALSRRL